MKLERSVVSKRIVDLLFTNAIFKILLFIKLVQIIVDIKLSDVNKVKYYSYFLFYSDFIDILCKWHTIEISQTRLFFYIEVLKQSIPNKFGIFFILCFEKAERCHNFYRNVRNMVDENFTEQNVSKCLKVINL